MNTKPSTEEAQRRLRLDDDLCLTLDLDAAIDQAHAELIELLDRHVYADAAALQAAIALAPAAMQAAVVQYAADVAAGAAILDDEARCAFETAAKGRYNTAVSASMRTIGGIVSTPGLISAQLLLIDALIGSSTLEENNAKQKAAENITWRHRRVGA